MQASTNLSTTDEVQFNPEDLDQSIQDSGVSTTLPLETQRAVAAYSMLAFALAMSVRDDSQYNAALAGLGGTPSDSEEFEFLNDFGQVLIRDIEADFSFAGMDLSKFSQRANTIVMQASAQCH